MGVHKVGGRLNMNFSKAERSLICGTLLYNEVTSIVSSTVLDGVGSEGEGEGAEHGEEMVLFFDVPHTKSR